MPKWTIYPPYRRVLRRTSSSSHAFGVYMLSCENCDNRLGRFTCEPGGGGHGDATCNGSPAAGALLHTVGGGSSQQQLAEAAAATTKAVVSTLAATAAA